MRMWKRLCHRPPSRRRRRRRDAEIVHIYIINMQCTLWVVFWVGGCWKDGGAHRIYIYIELYVCYVRVRRRNSPSAIRHSYE